MTDTHESPDHNEASGSPAEPSTHRDPASASDDLTPPFASLIAAIQAAVVRGASPDIRAAGVSACRSILTVLEARPGQPLVVSPLPPTSVSAAAPTSPIAALLAQPGLLPRLAAMSREDLITLIKQVTGAMPAPTHRPNSAAPRFHIVEIPKRGPR